MIGVTLREAVGHLISAVDNNRIEITALGACDLLISASSSLFNLNDCEVFLSQQGWLTLQVEGMGSVPFLWAQGDASRLLPEGWRGRPIPHKNRNIIPMLFFLT